MSDAQITRLREEIATCTRLLVMQGIMDFSGHVSARIPGTDRVLIQPRDTSRAAITADDILVVDIDGKVLEGKGPAPAETALHTCVYRARPDALTVCHGHPTISTLFSVVDRPLLAVRNFAYRFADEVPIHPDTTHIRTDEQGRAMMQTLGTHGVCLLRAHGTVVVSRSMQELFMDCLDFEENARSLLYATALGALLPLNPEEVSALRASYGRSDYRAGKLWQHYIHKGRTVGVL
ncbi:MAG: class II aldolase/adducin family protein [Deltaproteobacteria bacterium]|nr:class II aldolase/adducin family protein [Deltaproteobacteria bacterium]